MIIAFANHKGGTGKTTSTINIGRVLSKMGKKILLVDLDPQGNLSYSLGLSNPALTVADFLAEVCNFESAACEASGMHILPAGIDLYEKLDRLSGKPNPQFLLRNKLKPIAGQYDFVLMDCPPTMSLYTINALNAAEGVIIPLVFEILSIQGLDQILNEIKKIKQSANPEIKILGALGVIVSENRKLSEEVLQYVRDNYSINVFNNHIRNNVKAAEAPSFGESVIDYAPASISSKDYANVTNELLMILENINQLVIK